MGAEQSAFQNTNTFQFEIPDGQVIKFIVQTNTADGDSIVIRDSISTLYELNAAESILYTPANNSRLWITTKTNSSSFYFFWQYIDVTGYQKVQKPTGSIMPLNLTQNTFYQFTSPKDRVAFHTGTLDKTFDLSLSFIYVYDGDDLNAKYIGNLLNFVSSQNLSSTGKSLTLVNFYGTNTKSYGIANDYSAVSHYDSYIFFVLSSGIDYTGNSYVPNGLESAVTFYCIDSDESYITDLVLADRKNGAQAVHFKPLTPSDVYTNLLVYNINQNLPQYLPQQILTNTFTMVMFQCDLHLGLTSGPLYIWTLAAPGRHGTILSPSSWNLKTQNTVPYSTNITTTEKVKFLFNLSSVIISNPGARIRIEVGSSGNKPVFVEFNETAIDTGTKAAYGTYMATSFTGTTVASSFAMTFSVECLGEFNVDDSDGSGDLYQVFF
uniref:CUB_2 domain-containing protein n=1 Tax=Caenorhabditis tropicalis TaxID=1561998 RepID=A0A1I7U278_9PELO